MSNDFLNQNIKNIDWDTLSSYPNLDKNNLLESFQDYLNWDLVSQYVILKKESIKKFKDKLNWNIMFDYQRENNLSNDLIREYRKKFNWNMISLKTLSPEFIDEFYDLLEWELLPKYQNLTEDLIIKYETIISNTKIEGSNEKGKLWDDICKYQVLTDKIMRKFKNKLSLANILIYQYQNVTDNFINDNLSQINWAALFSYKNINEEIILKYFPYASKIDKNGNPIGNSEGIHIWAFILKRGLSTTFLTNIHAKLKSIYNGTNNMSYDSYLRLLESKNYKLPPEPSSQTTNPDDENPTNPNTNNDENNNIGKPGDALRIRNQSYTKYLVNKAISEKFWGIETNIFYEDNTFSCKNNRSDKSTYTLEQLLQDCKVGKIVAILSLKTTTHLEELINLVKTQGMFNSTIFQTDSTYVINKIYNINNKCRIWLLNSDNTSVAFRKSDLNKVKEKVEGINIFAKQINFNLVNQVHEMDLTICAFSFFSSLYGTADKLTEWGINYLMATSITAK